MSNAPFRTKICGVTSPADAVCIAALGGDAIGLNFYPPSRRSVSMPVAGEIVEVLPKAVTPVGLFVNESPERVNKIAEELKLNWVQLHGDEPPEYLSQLDLRLSILRAYRFESWQQVERDVAACGDAGRLPTALLIDACVPGEFGGTGKTADWAALAERADETFGLPLILAGGLTPYNVAEAIAQVRPEGIDTASGVESSPGSKDAKLMEQFLANARQAFSSL